MKNKKILEYRVGSWLYGTNTPESDEDYCGVIMPIDTQVFGFETLKEIDMSIKDKDSSGKNTKEAVDRKFYELRRFLKLAMENNPNIIEQLFVTTENILYMDDIGKQILKKAELFPHKGLKQKFLGYAFSQKHKMLVKPKNFQELMNMKEVLYEYVGVDSLKDLSNNEEIIRSKKYMVELMPYFEKIKAPIKLTDHYIKIGDINIQKSIMVKQAIQQIDGRLDKAGHRIDLFLKHGYDSKFGSHLLRLIFEGMTLLKYGYLEFPLPKDQLDIIMEVKRGEWTADRVVAYSEELENQVENLYLCSNLPYKPRYDEIQNLCMNILKKEFL